MSVEGRLEQLPRRRQLVNTVTRYVVGLGGAAVIGAIALIFVYLLWVVVPIFEPVTITPQPIVKGAVPSALLIDTDDNSEFGVALSTSGMATFFDLESGERVAEHALIGQEPFRLRAAYRVYPTNHLYALLGEDDVLRFVQIHYHVSFEGEERRVRPEISPAFEGSERAAPKLRAFDAYLGTSSLIWAGLSDSGELIVERYANSEVDYPLEFPQTSRLDLGRDFAHVIIGARADWLYILTTDGHVEVFDLANPTLKPVLDARLVRPNRHVSTAAPLLGRTSLLVADDTGLLTQWLLLRDELGYRMESPRRFHFEAPIVEIVPERRRKGFVAIDAESHVHLVYSTAGTQLAEHRSELAVAHATLAPRANRLVLASDAGDVEVMNLVNPHPEISWRTLWGRVWYEGYREPIYSWQSSSAESSFEPKFSLMPLAFGTMKAAFYAMLFAMPLAVMGAIYTAYFMAPSMRRWVKPGIEIMAALPSVILGFLAGLWLAPVIEKHLMGVLSVIVLLPIAMLVFAWFWFLLPRRHTAPFAGWYGALSVPLLLAFGAGIFVAAPIAEAWVFGGDLQAWLANEWGLAYDQRNALVVGLAMGLAVIPTIFAISEDAIYGVPRHLVNGSLALGANSWQTLVRVVLLTASPGIFSAVMIGLGRAVGETMIVLMATGNTPVMDLNIFQGMRTFAANIAVELPESEVDSSHYRILFLAALVLFLLTFVFNTAAELVRQRLRARYGSL